ncbi:MAG: glycine zipper 2TM domain-containing protein [Alphaproteobacteria bacterium]|jgi:surface antigen|nr:glycine zipper 2TM domain-containing protein [Alphaproteobacteria bacterium]MBT5916941.1 glycine zipper 2TM domain-containing protein [Alphaproteobacteria bacterium]
MKKLAVVFVSIAALTLAGCEGAGEKEKLGTILGAAAGAIAGSQLGSGKGRTTAIAVGTLLGSLAGSSVGKSLDKLDLLELQRTQQGSLENNPSGQVSTWNNPDSGNSGTITPQPARQTAQGVYCREYQQTITVGGRTEEAYGEACRQTDGTWKIVK